MRCVGWWSAGMLSRLGVRMEVLRDAEPPAGSLLIASNHVSWLDILAVNAVRPARFVSMADVRKWPVLGWLVASGGTLFIERERKRDALRVVHQIAAALEAGETIAVFPEGKTADGHALLPFHANLLQAAVSTGTPVQPMAVRYSDAKESVSQAASFAGEVTLLQSIVRVLTARDLQLRIRVLPLREPGENRAELGRLVKADIEAALARF